METAGGSDMKTLASIFCSIVLLLILVPTQAGSVAYSNVDPDGSYSGFGNWFGTLGAQTGTVAASFIAEQSGILDEIRLGMSLKSGRNTVTVKIFDDNNGAVGNNALWSVSATGRLRSPGSLFHMSQLNGLLLEKGKTYWLVGEAPDDGFTQLIWNRSAIDDPNRYALNYWNSWLYFDNMQNFAMELSVTPVPLPGAGWLLGSGLLGLIGITRRRKAA
jgi:hypothetical protein